jgi:hypothetical protein
MTRADASDRIAAKIGDSVDRASEAMKVSRYAVICLGLVALQAVLELAMGRPAICTCGRVEFWYGDLFGPGLSQHLTDWYSFTHITHGFVFYALLTLVAPRAAFGPKLVAMLALEVSWEVMENTPIIIDRYRQSALAQGYLGDSVINSVSDAGFAVVGFVFARGLPTGWSVAAVLVSEAALALLIHDNLLLDVVQLVHPMRTLSDWQVSGGYLGTGHL